MMPKDTNAYGTIFGGVILSYIDQAGAVEAKRHGAEFLVTVAMREVVFHEPVYVGDLVSFYTRLVKIGRTSITISVEVFSQTGEGLGNRVKVTEAEVTYVNLDKNRRPRADREVARPKYEGPDSSGPSSSPAEQEPGNGSSSGSILLPFSSAGSPLRVVFCSPPSFGLVQLVLELVELRAARPRARRPRAPPPATLPRRRSLRPEARGGRLRRGRERSREAGATGAALRCGRFDSGLLRGGLRSGLAGGRLCARPAFFAAFAGAFFDRLSGPSRRLLRGLLRRFFEALFRASFLLLRHTLPPVGPAPPGDPDHTIGELRDRQGAAASRSRPGRADCRSRSRRSSQDRGWRRRLAAIAAGGRRRPRCWAPSGSARPGRPGLRRGDFGDLPLPILIFLSLAVLVSAPLALARPRGPRLRRGAIDVDAGGRHDPDDRLREDPRPRVSPPTTSSAGARPTGRCAPGGPGRSGAWRPARAGRLHPVAGAAGPAEKRAHRRGPRRRHRASRSSATAAGPSGSRAA